MYFNLNDNQIEKLRDWLDNHNKTCKFKKKMRERNSMAVGQLEYCFTPYGVGEGVVVRCNCGDSINLTNITE